MYTLIIFKEDWEDEFDCQEFYLCQKSEKEVSKLIGLGCNKTHYFGTNQCFKEDRYGPDSFELKKISDVEGEKLIKLLSIPKHRLGFGLGIIEHVLETGEIAMEKSKDV